MIPCPANSNKAHQGITLATGEKAAGHAPGVPGGMDAAVQPAFIAGCGEGAAELRTGGAVAFKDHLPVVFGVLCARSGTFSGRGNWSPAPGGSGRGTGRRECQDQQDPGLCCTAADRSPEPLSYLRHLNLI